MPRRARYEGFNLYVKAVGTGERGRRSLEFEEARAAAAAILAGEATPAQIGAFFIALRIKGETPEEIAGIAAALRDATPRLRAVGDRPLVACAGAYDGCVDAPGLSLAAGVVAAAAGAGIVVHCGRPLGPKYGVTPADVLGALGGDAEPEPEISEATLARAGITLVHAGRALPGWAALAEVRDEIGPRGPVHSAEKLVDWFGASRFIVGFTHAPFGERLCGALELLGAGRAIAIRGLEGSDIVRPGRPIAIEDGRRLDLPEHIGDAVPAAPGAQASAAITRALVAGDADRVTEHAVALSAGLRLYVAGLAPTPLRGMAQARAALGDGRAGATLDALVG
jgi:anthranilate phosphoribosyltransferase